MGEVAKLLDTITNTLVGGINEAQGLAEQSAERARGFLGEGFDITREELTPFSALGRNALDAFADSLGIARADGTAGGPEAIDRLIAENPQFKFLQEQGQRAANSQLAAAGLTGSGRAAKELTRFGQGLASQQIGAFQQGLLGVINPALQASTTIAGAGQTKGLVSADIEERLGQTQANAALARSQAVAQDRINRGLILGVGGFGDAFSGASQNFRAVFGGGSGF